MNMIEFKNFSCFYKNKKEYITALDQVSFTIEQGELFVILGPSGCGKTTLLRCILGLCDYISGELTIDRIFEILQEPKANQQEKISFKVEDLRKYFPKSYSAAKIQETILKLLSDYQRKRQRAQER